MTTDIRSGSRGQTVGPLNPSGRIRINDEMFDARSEGDWIGADTNVVVIGSRSNNLIVRPLGDDDPPTESLGEVLKIGDISESTPLHAPPALVERFNAIAAGVVVGSVLIPIVWLRGTPLSIWALLVPASGAATGVLYQWFMRSARDSVAPREDHRLRAYEVAAMVVGGAAIGGFFGMMAGFGFLGLSCGLFLGALLGGFVKWIDLLLASI